MENAKKSVLRTRYYPVENGYEIIGSREMFNRTLYGSHANDHLPEKYFTFAGDLPIFMGAVTDWRKAGYSAYAKNGTLISGLAMARGLKTPAFYSDDVDVSSQWFHNSDDVVSVYRNGWMEYKLSQISPWFTADVAVNISVFPLLPDDGFLVHYKISTDQQIIFCAGFGGITDFISRLEYPLVKGRYFNESDCENTQIECGENSAAIKSVDGTVLRIGASFPVEVEISDAASLRNDSPGLFLANADKNSKTPVVKMFTSIGPRQILDGFLVVLRNASDAALEKWLTRENPAEFLKRQIAAKTSSISMHTPDTMLDLTLPPTVIAMDASWHEKTFYHGAHAYHTPFLGWRNWYGPTVIGWHDRVKTAIESHFSQIIKDSDGPEKIWYDGSNSPKLDHTRTQYHHMENSTGFLPSLLNTVAIYNMQEVAVDMFLHYVARTGDLLCAEKYFDSLCDILDWEERILDPDGDGLYQNFLNTWISDGHSYNGGGCAQSSSYNLYANVVMSRIAEKLDRPSSVFIERAQKIREALQNRLWLKEKGVLAEFVDTIGNKLVHPSPELSTIYLAIDCGAVDMFQAYQMLRFTRTDIKNIKTLNRQGRLAYSSNWYPKKYSTCGIFPAENLHLALAYFKMGFKSEGLEIFDAIVDAYFTGKNPGLCSHVLSEHGISDSGDLDFSDVSSMYIRTIVEGLFGIRFDLINDVIEIAPGFPDGWTHAEMTLKDFSLKYSRNDDIENFIVKCERKVTKKIRIPLRTAKVDEVLLNGKPAEYKIIAGINASFIDVETNVDDCLELQIKHGDTKKPCLYYSDKVFADGKLLITVFGGHAVEYLDTTGIVQSVEVNDDVFDMRIRLTPGRYSIFVRVVADDYDAWLPVDFTIEMPQAILPCRNREDNAAKFQPVDISQYFNMGLMEIHRQEYLRPRPAGYSIGVCIDGRYAWDWNQGGHNGINIDDSQLRNAQGGIFRVPSGIGFLTPSEGRNVACISIWENYPTVAKIPLHGCGSELALFFICSTNPMQTAVENVRISVTYKDGTTQSVSLIYPHNIDDWLNSALQYENETAYFSDFNHGIVQRIMLDEAKELCEVSIEAIANEVIFGLLGMSILPKNASEDLL